MEYEKEAKIFVDAIKKLGENEDALFNFESYLSVHFGEWLKQFANTPEELAYEMKSFSEMYDSERK
jgi:predicted DNA-binding ribbon-helix-helix protein